MSKELEARLREGVCAESTGCLPRQCACDFMDQAADQLERYRVFIEELRDDPFSDVEGIRQSAAEELEPKP